MKVDRLAPQLLIDYDLFCRQHGFCPFEDYVAHWYAATALIEAAEEEGRDPFSVTPDDLRAVLPEVVN